MEAKRRIHKFNFDVEKMKSGAKTHVALVDSAANQQEALILKSRYITQTTEIEEYSDDGNSSLDRHTVRISDYGDDMVRVVDEKLTITEQYVSIVN